MLFNSYLFLFVFLPVVMAGYFLLGRFSRCSRLANIWLMLASLCFYGYWDVHYLPLLVGSILVNYLLGWGILRASAAHRQKLSHGIFWLGIAGNIALLSFYKYLDFFFSSIDMAFGAHIPLLHLVLPLGISFFTITQILALIDCRAGIVKEHNFFDYALFVSFFPHLMAGPILFHADMMSQFQNARLRRLDFSNLMPGFCLFILGLAKKIIIADSFIQPVAWGFANATGLDFWQGWQVVLCYMMELYFDFSGYSDMAVGLARMMNLSIPINFNQPFRAVSLSNFWQRWHISLTNALFVALYQPIIRSFKNVRFCHTLLAASVTFFIVGIWHGAGWTFVVFALLQSVGIVVNQCWKHFNLPMRRPIARALTLLFVAVSFVFFRAPDLLTAKAVLGAMCGRHGFHLPEAIAYEIQPYLSDPLSVSTLLPDLPLRILFFALIAVVFLPDSNRIIKRFQPKWYVALAFAALFVYSVLELTHESLFLYFQF